MHWSPHERRRAAVLPVEEGNYSNRWKYVPRSTLRQLLRHLPTPHSQNRRTEGVTKDASWSYLRPSCLRGYNDVHQSRATGQGSNLSIRAAHLPTRRTAHNPMRLPPSYSTIESKSAAEFQTNLRHSFAWLLQEVQRDTMIAAARDRKIDTRWPHETL